MMKKIYIFFYSSVYLHACGYVPIFLAFGGVLPYLPVTDFDAVCGSLPSVELNSEVF